jgi:hypothetical protein
MNTFIRAYSILTTAFGSTLKQREEPNNQNSTMMSLNRHPNAAAHFLQTQNMLVKSPAVIK